MLQTDYSSKVKDILQAEETMTKVGMTDEETYNRYLDFCQAIYDTNKTVAQIIAEIKNNTIDNYVIYQIMKSRKELVDEEVLDEKIVKQLTSTFDIINKNFTDAR